MHQASQILNSISTATHLSVRWLILLMTMVTFLIVVLRYAFDLGWVWLQDIVLYSHATLLMLSIPQTLKINKHVRVDIFFANLDRKKQLTIDSIGHLFFSLPVCFLILYYSYDYVLASWETLEGSKDGGGLEAVYLLKSLLILFPILFALQCISHIFEARNAKESSEK